MTPDHTPPPALSGAASPPSAARPADLSPIQIAQIAAHQALAVPGVIRLQPGLRHAVGRAARALFIPGAPADDQSAAEGIDVRLTPDPQLTLRVVTTADPTPWTTARALQDQVTATLRQQTGKPFTVVVVVVDVDADM